MPAQSSRAHATYERFQPPKRILLGPGPSPVDERVLSAMAAPVLGHLDPLFLGCMDDVQALLRYVFETDEELQAQVRPFRNDVGKRFDEVATQMDGLYQRDEKREQEYLSIREQIRRLEAKFA